MFAVSVKTSLTQEWVDEVPIADGACVKREVVGFRFCGAGTLKTYEDEDCGSMVDEIDHPSTFLHKLDVCGVLGVLTPRPTPRKAPSSLYNPNERPGKRAPKPLPSEFKSYKFWCARL